MENIEEKTKENTKEKYEKSDEYKEKLRHDIELSLQEVVKATLPFSL